MKQITPWRFIPDPGAPLNPPAAPRPAAPGRAKMTPIGLGDWIWSWAHPLAGWIDRRARPGLTKLGLWRPDFRLASCFGCSWRRALYNRVLPDVASWAAWRTFPGLLRAHLKAGGHLFRAPRMPAARPLQGS